MSTEKCPPGKHNYQARYDEIVNVEATSTAAFWNGKAVPPDRIYVGEVCSRCGDFIQRKPETRIKEKRRA